MKSTIEINAELCRALGIHDLRDVCEVVLTLAPGKLPSIVVRRVQAPDEGRIVAEQLGAAVQRLQLKPDLAP